MPRFGSVCEERVCRVPQPASFVMSLWMRWASISRSSERSAGDGPWVWLSAERALLVGAADDGMATAAPTARTSPADSATRRTLDMVPPVVGCSSHTRDGRQPGRACLPAHARPESGPLELLDRQVGVLA